MDMVRHIPQNKRQELYDFAHFLAEKYTNVQSEERIAAFESEDEMIDFITDIGGQVYGSAKVTVTFFKQHPTPYSLFPTKANSHLFSFFS